MLTGVRVFVTHPFVRVGASRLGSLGRRRLSRVPTMAPTRKVLVPVADGTEEMEAVIVIDVLRRAGAQVTVASVEKELKVVASRGVNLVADAGISECTQESFDLVVLPGGATGAEHLRDSKTLEQITRTQAEQQRLYAAICAAPAVALESWGLLKGLKATCHPSFASRLSDQSSLKTRVVKDGQVVTSQGPGTAMEFALALVEQLYTSDKASEVSKGLILYSGQSAWKAEFNEVAWPAKVSSEPKILVPIANGSEEMEAVIIIDVLRRAGMTVVVASVEETLQVEASRKVRIEADKLITDVQSEEFDAVFLPGGMPGAEHLRVSKELGSILSKQAEEGRVYGAICASPAVVLESMKLLSGKKVTAFPAFQSKLSDQSAAGSRVVIDGLVATSQGPGTAMEFALAIVEKFMGKDTASKVAAPMLVNFTV